MRKFEIIKYGLSIVAFLLAFNVHAGKALHTASDIVKLQAACVKAWEKIDHVIPEYGAFSTTPWSDNIDKAKFIEFQKAFKLTYTKTGSRDYATMANDALLVASECTKLHNLIVNAHFNRNTGAIPQWKERIDITAILQYYMMDD